MRYFILFCLCTIPFRLSADPLTLVAEAASRSFDRMPPVEIVPAISGNCGADATVHPDVAYCTSRNVILVSEDAAAQPETAYLLAHAYGHAVQVQHGVADVALREIRSRSEEEDKLRGWVERQVDCIAGFVLARAAVPLPDIAETHASDPLDRPHWGRNPLARGPHVAVPVAERASWLENGYEGGLQSCAVGEFEATLLVAALNS